MKAVQHHSYEPPYYRKRIRSEREFQRLEEHLIYWNKNGVYHPALIDELKKPHAGLTLDSNLPFHERYLNPKEGVINPSAKSWAFMNLLDGPQNICATYFGVGIHPDAAERYLHEEGDGLPINDLSWTDFFVPDPAQPDNCRFTCIYIYTNWNRPDWVEPLLEVAFRYSELLQIDTLFTQLDEVGDEDHSPYLEKLHFKRKWSCLTRSDPPIQMSLWMRARIRESIRLDKVRYRSLIATPEQIVLWSKFYQSLRKDLRDELIRMSEGYDVPLSVKRTGKSRRTIDGWRHHIRESLTSIGNQLNYENIDLRGFEDFEINGAKRKKALKPNKETRSFLSKFGIDHELGNLQDLTSYLRQSLVSQIIERLAWFYEDLPSQVNGELYDAAANDYF